MKKEKPIKDCPSSLQSHILVVINAFGGGVALTFWWLQNDIVGLVVGSFCGCIALCWEIAYTLHWVIQRQERKNNASI